MPSAGSNWLLPPVLGETSTFLAPSGENPPISAEQMEQLLPRRAENQWFGMCGQHRIELLVCFLLIISVFICLAKNNPFFLDTVGSAPMHWQAHYHWSLAAGCFAKVGNYHYEGKRCYLIGWTPAAAWSCDPPRAHRAQLYTYYIGRREQLKGQTHLLAKSDLQQWRNIMIWDLKGGVGDNETCLVTIKTQQRQWKDGRYCLNTALVGTPKRMTCLMSLPCWRRCKVVPSRTWPDSRCSHMLLYSKSWVWLHVSHRQAWGHGATAAPRHVSSNKLSPPAWLQSSSASSSAKAGSWRACICLQERLKTFPML